MSFELYRMALAVVASAALLRLGWILVGKVRQLFYARRAVSTPKSWRDYCAFPEPFVMAAFAWLLWAQHEPPQPLGPAALACAVAAALTAVLGLALSFWSFASFPAVSTGHYVLPDHRLVTSGAYGWVRHPIYLGAFLIWLGLVLGFRSASAAITLLLYVLPAYLVYIRAEEEMLARHLGDEYRRYRAHVGGLFPRWSRARARTP